VTTTMTPQPAPERAGGQRGRQLTDGEHAAVMTVGAAVAGFALLGFANSFAAVMAAARPSFGPFAATVPLGIDLGIAIFAALDIVLARLDMRPRWVRLVPWALTACTVYLNIAGQHTWFGRIAHAVFPALWVMAVEVGAHVIRIRAGLAAGTAMDRIRPSRWLLAPLPTAVLWRRMVLWETRSYPDALARERDRVLARTELADAYGWRWRWAAPRRTRALYRLGELTPGHHLRPGNQTAGPALPDTAPAPRALPAAPPRKPARKPAGRSRPAVPDVDALMPLGWQITANLAALGMPLTRDTLAAALREAGQTAGNARVGALLTRLRTEAPADPADLGPESLTAVLTEGDPR
jgi:hypothetical protein